MSRSTQSARVAVVGAGLSGLTCARGLVDRGHMVRVFDKGRGPGGRASTRRALIDGAEVGFDHGAQYFTLRERSTRERVARWIEDDVVRRWEGRIAVLGPGGAVESYSEKDRYVGTPGMSALCAHLASGLDIRCGVTVGSLDATGDGIVVLEAGGRPLGGFDFAVVTAPPAQAARIIERASPALASHAASVVMKPCWAVLLAFAQPLEAPYDGAFINEGPLSWVARASSKPRRTPSPDRWVLHANAEWSADYLESTPDLVAPELLDAFFAATGIPYIEPRWITAHRWRYALAENPLELGCLLDSAARVALCGDWTNANRVEGALLSGATGAERIHEALLVDPMLLRREQPRPKE